MMPSVPYYLANPNMNLNNAPVEQTPTPDQPWYNSGLIGKVGDLVKGLGGVVTKPNVIPALAGTGSIAAALSGDRGGTPFQNFTGAVQNMAGGYNVAPGMPGSTNRLAAPPMQTDNTAPSTSAKPIPQSPQVKMTATGDLNGDGKVDYNDIKINMSMNGQGQQSGMSNIKQMDSISSRQDLPGMLSNPTPSSFYQGSGDSTGNPESVLTSPVGNATPDERAYALALLAGNPAIGASGVMKHTLDSETQRINERKAEAEGVAANASLQKAYADMQKADLEGAKFRYELGPVDAEGKVQSYIDRQGAIEYAKKKGDKQAELWLRDQIIADASTVPVREPNLKRYGDTYGDVMRTLGITDLGTIVNADRNANARIEAARLSAGGAITSAGIQAAGVERAAVQNAMTGAIAMRKMMGNIELPLPDGHPDKPSQERDFLLKNKIKASPEQMKQAEALDTEIKIYRERLSALGVGTTPQKVASTKPSPKVGSEVTVELNGKKVKAKVVGSGVVEYNGKKYNIK